MKKITLLLFLSILLCSYLRNTDIFGKYYTIEKDRTSILELKNDGKFIYTFQHDSFCGGEVQGKYKIVNKRIKFEND